LAAYSPGVVEKKKYVFILGPGAFKRGMHLGLPVDFFCHGSRLLFSIQVLSTRGKYKPIALVF
jgi:hypothetical protein